LLINKKSKNKSFSFCSLSNNSYSDILLSTSDFVIPSKPEPSPEFADEGPFAYPQQAPIKSDHCNDE
jgi:hypothetical protein